jgi:glycine/D-amino acid oxidase-like deaminating enzyme/nitrite reductase/ring-hydroxylating ferredoxin subunit
MTLERSKSPWMEIRTQVEPPVKGLDGDVVIIGAGITGLSAAYELACAGRKVLILDRAGVGAGMTGRTTAHLASALDDYYHRLVKLRGKDVAAAHSRHHARAIDRIEQIQTAESISCDFTRLPGLHVPARKKDEKDLQAELEACREIGMSGVDWQTIELGGQERQGLLVPNQARFHPLKYLDGIVHAVRRRGGEIALASVDSYREKNGTVHIETDRGLSIAARHLILATNGPINNVTVTPKTAPFRTYALACEVAKGSVPDLLLWDTLDPYHYVRIQPQDQGTDLLIIGGEDHKTGDPDEASNRFERLLAWARKHWPDLGKERFRWSGQVLEPIDHMPFVGRAPGFDRVYLATGDSGQGMTNGVNAAIILAELILDGEAGENIYAPARLPPKAAKEIVQDVAATVAGIASHLLPAEVSSADEIKPDSGAVLRRGVKKVAAYRAGNGTLFVVSAACTHAGCVVAWNGFEKCWDCGCHGSHFDVDGKVLSGPATKPLKVEREV